MENSKIKKKREAPQVYTTKQSQGRHSQQHPQHHQHPQQQHHPQHHQQQQQQQQIDTAQKIKSQVLPPTKPNRFLGRFFWQANTPAEDLDLSQEQRLREIVEFYDDEVIETMFLPIISKKDILSLREIDWAVTNFTKKNPVIYKAAPFQREKQPHLRDTEIAVNIHTDYKKWLSNFKRRTFDMFRRGKRIFFEHDGQTFSTTVGQLNFFHWAERYGVLSYIRSNLQQIKTDHIIATKRPPENDDDIEKKGCKDKKRRRRRELSQAPKSKCFVFNMNVSVNFD